MLVTLPNVWAGLDGIPVETFHNPNEAAQRDSRFGRSVAISGDLLAIASAESTTGGATGVVRVYSRSSRALLHKLHLPWPRDFGRSIAFWGTRLLVGEPGSDWSNYRILIFNLAGTTPTVPVHTISNPREKGRIGRTMAVSGDRLLVGLGHSEEGALVYTLSTSKAPKLTHVIKTPASHPLTVFGSSVALAGNRAVVTGLEGSSRGKVFLYNLSSATPGTPTAVLTSPALEQNGRFGSSLYVEGSRLVIGAAAEDAGAGNAYLVDVTKRVPSIEMVPKGSGSDWRAFGSQLSISGNRLCVSALPIQSASGGRCFVYDLSTSTLAAPILTLPNPQPTSNDDFGSALALSESHLLVGAPSSNIMVLGGGLAHLHDLSSLTPGTPVHTFFEPGTSVGDGFGSSIAVTSTHLIVAASSIHRVYVFDRQLPRDSAPVHVLTSPGHDASFGSSVAADGGKVVVASASAATAYVFDLSQPDPQATAVTLTNPHAGSLSGFGSSISISGSLVAVGAPGAQVLGSSSWRGKVFIYDLSGATPSTHVREVRNPVTSWDEWFGTATALQGTRLVVSSPHANNDSSSGGRLYVYDLVGPTPGTPTHTLQNPSTDFNFGDFIAIDGNRVVTSLYSGGNSVALVFEVPWNASPASVKLLMDAAMPARLHSQIGHRTQVSIENSTVLVSYGAYPYFGLFDLATNEPHQLKVAAGRESLKSFPTDGCAVSIKDGVLFFGDAVHASTSKQRGAVHEITLPQQLPPIVIPPSNVAFGTGTPLILDASASYQPGDPVVTAMRSYQWEIGYDSNFTDAIGPAPVIPWSSIPQPNWFQESSNYTLRVKVTAPNGLSSISSFNASFRSGTIRITSPANARVFKESSQTVTLRGESSVFPVKVFRNGVLPETVASPDSTTGNTLQTWSQNIQLLPGTNTLVAKSNDLLIASTPVTLFYEVKRPISVTSAVAAHGTVSTSPSPSSGGRFILGKLYTVSARPKQGYLFDSWSGANTSTSSTVSVSFSEGDSLQANFVPTPFVGDLPGTYRGVLQGSTPVTQTQEQTGRIEVTITKNSGILTGKVLVDGLTLPLKGRISHRDFTFSTSIPVTGLSVNLLLHSGGVSPRLSGQVTRWRNGTAVAHMPVNAQQTHSSRHPLPAALTGTFHLGFSRASSPGGLAAADIPQGKGFAVLTVASVSGAATIVCTLANGTVSTSASRVCRDGTLPVHTALAQQSGSLTGLALLDTASQVHDLTASDIRWHQRPSLLAAYPFGFAEEGLAMSMTGDRRSSSALNAMQLGNTPLLVIDGNPLASPVSVILVRDGNTFKSADNHTRVSITSTGHIAGQTTLFSNTGVSAIKGLVVQKGVTATQHLFVLQPRPSQPGAGRLSGLVELSVP